MNSYFYNNYGSEYFRQQNLYSYDNSTIDGSSSSQNQEYEMIIDPKARNVENLSKRNNAFNLNELCPVWKPGYEPLSRAYF